MRRYKNHANTSSCTQAGTYKGKGVCASFSFKPCVCMFLAAPSVRRPVFMQPNIGSCSSLGFRAKMMMMMIDNTPHLCLSPDHLCTKLQLEDLPGELQEPCRFQCDLFLFYFSAFEDHGLRHYISLTVVSVSQSGKTFFFFSIAFIFLIQMVLFFPLYFILFF